MGIAIAQLAEQQMRMETRVTDLDTHVTMHLDRATAVIGDVQRRMDEVERCTTPGQVISDDQASEISSRVKSLAQFLASKAGNTGYNQYQAIFGELYRLFGVSSYKLIRQTQYQGVLEFFEEWRKAELTDAP